MRKGRRKLTVHLSGLRQGDIYGVSVYRDKIDHIRHYDCYPLMDAQRPLTDASIGRIKRLISDRSAVWATQSFAGMGDRAFDHTMLVYEWNDPKPAWQVRRIIVNRFYERPIEVQIENRRGDAVTFEDVSGSSLYRIERLMVGMVIRNAYLSTGVISIEAALK